MNRWTPRYAHLWLATAYFVSTSVFAWILALEGATFAAFFVEFIAAGVLCWTAWRLL